MKKIADAHLEQQEKVNAYFHSQSSYWKDIYGIGGAYAEIHRDRHAAILNWIDSLALAPGTRVLEIGCGAGFMSIALAQRGFRVHATDSTEAMVEQARQQAEEYGVTNLLSVNYGDAHALAFDKESFDLVIAIGVIPWLEHAELAIQEMARVTKPGGYVIFTADNRARLNALLDPWLNPVLQPLKRRVKDALERAGLRHGSFKDIGTTFHTCRFIDKTIEQAGLSKTKGMTLGFGPFSLFRHEILPGALGVALHHRLQRIADRGVPGFRSIGAHYIVLGRKSMSQPLVQSTSLGEPVPNVTVTL
ncbi:MAG: hypothetical protein NVS4B7_02390 [Ktedonobacteraceae bacterium]